MTQTSPIFRRSNTRLLAAAALACLHVGALAQVATVERAVGSVQASTANASARALAVGSTVDNNTEIVTGANGEVTLRFLDGHIIALKDNSIFRVAEVVYNQQRPEVSNFAVQLLRGGLRSVTGLIGRANPRSFRVTTPTATIGIRGSDILGSIVNNNLVTGVNSGGMSVTTSQGVLNLNPGQFAVTNSSGLSQLTSLANLPSGAFGNLQNLTFPNPGQPTSQPTSQPSGSQPSGSSGTPGSGGPPSSPPGGGAAGGTTGGATGGTASGATGGGAAGGAGTGGAAGGAGSAAAGGAAGGAAAGGAVAGGAATTAAVAGTAGAIGTAATVAGAAAAAAAAKALTSKTTPNH